MLLSIIAHSGNSNIRMYHSFLSYLPQLYTWKTFISSCECKKNLQSQSIKKRSNASRMKKCVAVLNIATLCNFHLVQQQNCR